MYKYLAFEKLPEVVLGDLAQDPQLLGRTAATAFKKFLSDHADLKELAEEALINAWNKVKLGKLEQTKAVSHAEKILTQGNQETASTSVVKKIEYAGKVAGNIKFNDKQLKVSLNISSIDNASLDKLEILLKELVERNEKV
jgi:ParB family transcriptional regulator, chromosome partitioning protein